MSRLQSGSSHGARAGLVERALQVLGLAALGVVAAGALDALVFQWQSQRAFQQQLERAGPRTRAEPADPRRSPRDGPRRLEPGTPLGLLQIPAIELSVMLIEGTDAANLRRAVGRIDGTALPGESGNLGIAGHRDGFFRGLRELQPGALVRLQTVRATYEYRVMATRVVPPEDVAVLRPSTPGRTLTLVTCHPFDYVGSAPERFVVHAAEIGASME